MSGRFEAKDLRTSRRLFGSWQISQFFLGSDKAGIRQRSNEEITLESFDRAGPMRHQARDSGKLNQNAGTTVAAQLLFSKSVQLS